MGNWGGFVSEGGIVSEREFDIDFAVLFLSGRLNTLNIIGVYC